MELSKFTKLSRDLHILDVHTLADLDTFKRNHNVTDSDNLAKTAAKLAAEKLFNAYQSLVHRVYNDKFKQYESNYIIADDLLQEGMIALWKACLNFDPERGVKFVTYAYTGIYQAMLCYAQRQFAKSQNNVSLSAVICKTDKIADDKTVTYSDIIPSEQFSSGFCELTCAISQMLEAQDDFSRSVFKYAFFGYTQQEIANMFQTSQATISRILRRIRKAIKAMIYQV